MTTALVAPVTAPVPETVTPLAPHEALRLGRLRVPKQAKGRLYRRMHGAIVAACDLGAIRLSYGVVTVRALVQLLSFQADHPLSDLYLDRDLGRLPCGHGARSIGVDSYAEAVIHLNDAERWPSARTSLWLEAQGQ